MRKLQRQLALFELCTLFVMPAAASAQAPATVQEQKPAAPPAPTPAAPAPSRRHPAPPSTVSVDGSEAMFTTMCVLLASGFESNVSADNWTAFRAQMRERLRQQQGPAVDAAREFYRQHELRDPGATLSRYLWFGLVSGPAPAFQPLLRRDELPPEVIALEGFSEILSNYYQEQKIGRLWRQVQPIYNREIERLHDKSSGCMIRSRRWSSFRRHTCAKFWTRRGRERFRSSSSHWLGASPTCVILEITILWC